MEKFAPSSNLDISSRGQARPYKVDALVEDEGLRYITIKYKTNIGQVINDEKFRKMSKFRKFLLRLIRYQLD